MIKINKKLKRVFHIEIVEMLSNIVEVSAENEQEALLKVQDMYRNEEVFYILMIVLIPNLIFLNTIRIA